MTSRFCPHCGGGLDETVSRAGRPRRNKDPDFDQKCADLYSSGKAMGSIAAELDCANTTVRAALVRLGVEIRPRNFKKHHSVIIAALKAGQTQADVAREHHLSRERVRQIAVREGLTENLKEQKWRLLDQRNESIAADAKAGMNSHQLAEKYGVGPGTIYNILREHGISMPHRGPQMADDTREMIGLFDAGASVEEIATRFERPKNSVTAKLHRYGRTLRRRCCDISRE